MASHFVKINEPKRIFILFVLLCLFQQLNVWLTYSNKSYELIKTELNVRSLSTEPITQFSSHSSHEDGKKMKILKNTTEIVNIPMISSTIREEDKGNSSSFDHDMGEDNIERLFVVTQQLKDSKDLVKNKNLKNVKTAADLYSGLEKVNDKLRSEAFFNSDQLNSEQTTRFDKDVKNESVNGEKVEDEKEMNDKSENSDRIITTCDDQKVTTTDGIERAMFVISMGEKAAKTKTIERFVYSARQIGLYCGWIVVLTDAPPGRYDKMMNWTNNVIFIEPQEDDVKTHYEVPNMIYKRFKTKAIEYMNRDARLDRVELIYYLDADIVFGNNMIEAFHGIETTYGIGRLGINSTKNSLGRGRMWMFKGNSKKWQIQGGQIILDRYQSQPCLERWRKGFDDPKTRELGKDQYLLMEMKAEMDEARNASLTGSSASNHAELDCEIVMMEQKPYLEFPLVKDIRKRSKYLRSSPSIHYDYSPMVHVRNDGGTATMKTSRIKPYMANLLRFKKGQKDRLGILKKVVMETS